MSTRGAYGFRINETDKVTYNHSDSYPEWLGKGIIQFIKDTSDKEMEEIAKRIVLINEDDIPTLEQIKVCQKMGLIDASVSSQSETDWYCLLRDGQGSLDIYRKKGEEKPLLHMMDRHKFLNNSLFCEWAYIINLDTYMFEAYKGFNKNDFGKGRYSTNKSDGDDGYYGVRLILEMPFDEIRDMDIDDLVELIYDSE